MFVVCHVLVCYTKSLFYHSFLFSCFILHTHKNGFIKSAHTHMHACLQVDNEKKNTLANEVKCNSSVLLCLGVSVNVCGNVYWYDNFMNVKSFYMMAVHMTFTRDAGHKYEIPLSSAQQKVFLRSWKWQCVRFFLLTQINSTQIQIVSSDSNMRDKNFVNKNLALVAKQIRHIKNSVRCFICDNSINFIWDLTCILNEWNNIAKNRLFLVQLQIFGNTYFRCEKGCAIGVLFCNDIGPV